MILPATDIEGATIYLDRLMTAVRGMTVNYCGTELHITLSAGVSSMEYTFGDSSLIDDRHTEESFSILQREADNALYQSKYEGKDRYSIYDPAKKEDYSRFRMLYTKK